MFISSFLKKRFTTALPFSKKSQYISFQVDESNIFHVAKKNKFKGRVKVVGSDNYFFLPASSSFSGSLDVTGEKNLIKIGENVRFSGRIVVNGINQSVVIGDYSTFQSVYLLCSEGCDINIGSWCMFSRDIEVRTTDAHSLVDVKSFERINQPGSIEVGDHVWVGVGSLISKGTYIPNDSVVGAHSFINKKFEDENVLIAGTPASIIKRNVTWHRSCQPSFTKEQLDHWKEPPSKTE